jgi:hypothetical protein
MKKYLKIILFVFLLCLILVCVWFWYAFKKQSLQEKVAAEEVVQKNEASINQEDAITVVKQNLDTSTWKTYRNEDIGIEFKYPSEWGNIQENKEQACLNFSEQKRVALLQEKDPCLHIGLSVEKNVFLATDSPLTTKYGFPRGADWTYKKTESQTQDFCNKNPYFDFGKLENCHVFQTKNNIKVTSGIQQVPFAESEFMIAYYIHTPNPTYSTIILSSNYLMAPSYIEDKKTRYISDESVMKLLIESIHFIQ